MLNGSTSRGIQPLVGLIPLLFLLFTLGACGGNGQTPIAYNTTHVGASENTNNVIPAVQIKQGTQPCPETVSTKQYWDALVPTQPSNNAIENVTCASLIGTASLQALVTIRSAGSGRALDVRVYNNITAPRPDKVFQLQNLLNGEARISAYNTIVTGEVDQNSQVNQNQNNANFTVDLFREFKWFNNTHTFYPVAFPGLFPELTRYEAESDQQKVNQGQQAWQLDAVQVANRFANTYLKWPLTSNTTVESGGRDGNGDATVVVKDSEADNSSLKVVMSRLEHKTTNGIWIVKGVISADLTLTTPTNLDVIKSPITITGNGNATGGAIGQASILDHLSEKIGNAQVMGNKDSGSTNFSSTISFQPTFTNGDEEGIVVVYTYSSTYGTISGISMTKVLLQ